MRKAIAVLACAGLLGGCSVKKYAVNQLGNALAGLAPSFAADDDPELIRSAVPFTLKLIETLLVESPRNRGLLQAAASGFTQYAYAFLQQDAEEIEERDRATAGQLRARAKKLYLRSRDYGMNGIELKHPGFRERLKANPAEAVKALKKEDVPFVYWTAISWAAALSVSRDLFLVPEIPRIEALIERCLELDEGYDNGVIHGFLITYEMNRLKPKGDKFENAKFHFDRAMYYARGGQAGPLVAYAENVSVLKKDKEEFQRLLNQALKINLDAAPNYRQLNLVNQRRARWLLSRTDRLFPPARR
jgi:predicted anti-sigma-YlaC factor YlaD